MSITVHSFAETRLQTTQESLFSSDGETRSPSRGPRRRQRPSVGRLTMLPCAPICRWGRRGQSLSLQVAGQARLLRRGRSRMRMCFLSRPPPPREMESGDCFSGLSRRGRYPASGFITRLSETCECCARTERLLDMPTTGITARRNRDNGGKEGRQIHSESKADSFLFSCACLEN